MSIGQQKIQDGRKSVPSGVLKPLNLMQL
jgi:hypothetical protein